MSASMSLAELREYFEARMFGSIALGTPRGHGEAAARDRRMTALRFLCSAVRHLRAQGMDDIGLLRQVGDEDNPPISYVAIAQRQGPVTVAYNVVADADQESARVVWGDIGVVPNDRFVTPEEADLLIAGQVPVKTVPVESVQEALRFLQGVSQTQQQILDRIDGIEATLDAMAALTMALTDPQDAQVDLPRLLGGTRTVRLSRVKA